MEDLDVFVQMLVEKGRLIAEKKGRILKKADLIPETDENHKLLFLASYQIFSPIISLMVV